ncbi:hypothetical protein AB0J84_32335, partial [Micromonospora arborensis]|uniref:hypothetical protein n=1 Tax=Micromonospora arborensis TaxID=2116518 RepID=UPI0034437D73
RHRKEPGMTPERIAQIRAQSNDELRTGVWADNVIDELLAEVESLQAAQGAHQDPAQARAADLSHAALVAVLMAHGGSLTIPATAFQPDSIGGPDGSFHALAMDTRGDLIHLSVQPRPDVDGAGIITEDGPR